MNEIKQHGFEIVIQGIFGRNRKVKTKFHTYAYGDVGMAFDVADAEKAVAQFADAIKTKPGKCAFQVRRADSILTSYTDPNGQVIQYRMESIMIGAPAEILFQGKI